MANWFKRFNVFKKFGWFKKFNSVLQYFHLNRVEYVVGTVGLLCLHGYQNSAYALFAVAGLMLGFRKFVTCDNFDYRNVKTFKEFDNEHATLKYVDVIPVLTYKSNDPYINGFSHGKYLADYITKISIRLRLVSMLFKKTDFSAIRISKKYVDEIRGIVDGYNSTNPWLKLDAETVLRFNMLPDLECRVNHKTQVVDQRYFDCVPEQLIKPHSKSPSKPLSKSVVESSTDTNSPTELYNPSTNQTNPTATPAVKQPIISVGCSCVFRRDEDGILTFGRNMDWLPYGDLAKYSLVIKNGNVSAFGLPCMVGLVTGWNDKGLIVAMNVCPCLRGNGVPSLFYNRDVLEQCETVADVEFYIQGNQPYITYQLSIADVYNNCKSIAMKPDCKHVMRGLCDDKLLTFNFGYLSGGEAVGDDLYSKERRDTANDVEFNDDYVYSVVKTVPINNLETCHSLIFHPSKRCVYLAWNNGFAGSMPRRPYKY